jgi:hypothetical protein
MEEIARRRAFHFWRSSFWIAAFNGTSLAK